MTSREWTEEEQAAVWLSLMPHVGPAAAWKLRDYAGSLAGVRKMSEGELETSGAFRNAPLTLARWRESRVTEETVQRVLCRMERQNIRIVLAGSEEYPEKLAQLTDPPAWLFVRGRLPDPSVPCAAVIGARAASAYGRQEAAAVGSFLAENGIQVVSGMASGIDSCCQEAVLRSGGRTFAVLGCGINICYPRESVFLYDRIPDRGGLISEYPLDVEPVRWHFPVRNRLISGLADLVLVVEARKRSGSLITADLALDQGKEVMAFPGYRTSPLSEGTNRLIRVGAGIVTSFQDILDVFDIVPSMCADSARLREKQASSLAKPEKMVYSAIDLRPKSVDELLRATGLSQGECLKAVFRLEQLGLICQSSNQYYVRTIAR
jgi:DNA processing protein